MPSKDLYPDLDTLKARYRRWQHYNIRIFDMLSDVTIVSPHGGFIEAGTSHIAQLVAGRNYNFFDFQGLLTELPRKLPHYAVPLFLRLSEKMETTGTFKHKKAPLKDQGFDPMRCADPLYAWLPGEERYVPVDAELHAAIQGGEYRY